MIGLLITATIIAFVSGNFLQQEISFLKNSFYKKEEVKSATIKVLDKDENVENEDSAKIDIKIEANSNTTNTKAPIQKSEDELIREFVYPHSELIRINNNSLVLKTSEKPETVTDWYKEKIEKKNFSAKSFVSTSTNGKVLNKLAADGEFKIEIEIKSETNITEVVINLFN